MRVQSHRIMSMESASVEEQKTPPYHDAAAAGLQTTNEKLVYRWAGRFVILCAVVVRLARWKRRDTMPRVLVKDEDQGSHLIRERKRLGIDKYDEVWEGMYVMPSTPSIAHQKLLDD